jgi:hypothetical protein
MGEAPRRSVEDLLAADWGMDRFKGALPTSRDVGLLAGEDR